MAKLPFHQPCMYRLAYLSRGVQLEFEYKNHYLEAEFHFTDNRNDLSANYQAGGDFRDDFLEYDSKVSNFSLDYVQPFSNGMVVESGLLYTIKDVSNDQSINDYDDSNQENIHEVKRIFKS